MILCVLGKPDRNVESEEDVLKEVGKVLKKRTYLETKTEQRTIYIGKQANAILIKCG